MSGGKSKINKLKRAQSGKTLEMREGTDKRTKQQVRRQARTYNDPTL